MKLIKLWGIDTNLAIYNLEQLAHCLTGFVKCIPSFLNILLFVRQHIITILP